MEQVIILLGWFGVYSVMAFGAIGSVIGCAKAGQTACGAMLDTEVGHGKFIGLSAMPSSQSIYGIVMMFILKDKIALFADNPQFAGAVFVIGTLTGIAMMFSAIYQGECCASAINASKTKPEVFGKSVAPAGIVEGFAVFALIMAIIMASMIVVK